MRQNLLTTIIWLTLMAFASDGFGQDGGSNDDIKEITSYPLNGVQLNMDGIVDE